MEKNLIELFDSQAKELYNSIMERPLRILQIFNDFFGEDKVDMQNYYSLDEFLHWLKTAPLSEYIPRNIIGNLVEETNILDIDKKTIDNLSSNIIEKIIEVFKNDSLRVYIGILKFKDIFILIHFPHVRVTNENDRFVDINHLWAKVKIKYNGIMEGIFTLNRSEYSLLHFNNNYLHSHVRTIPKHDFTQFEKPCVGVGPIKNTMTLLNIEYNEDIWNMFCLELSKYVTVESIDGIPYHYLEKLTTDNLIRDNNKYIVYERPNFSADILRTINLKEFVKYFINLKKLKFNYIKGSYSIGMSYIEFIILISNAFIDWYNELYNKKEVTTNFLSLKDKSILRECIINNNNIYYYMSSYHTNNYSSYTGKKVCTFKGKEITVNIVDTDNENNNKSVILNIKIALYILTNILKVLNYRYGRDKAICQGDKFGTEVKYL